MTGKQPCRHKGHRRTRVRKCSRCQSRDSPAVWGEDDDEAGCPSATHGQPHTTAGGCVLKEAAAHGELMLEQASGKTCDLWGTHGGAVHS